MKNVANLSDQLVVGRVVGSQHVVRGPLDHVVSHVQLSGRLVPVLELVHAPQQHVSGGAEGQSELNVVAG